MLLGEFLEKWIVLFIIILYNIGVNITILFVFKL
jgi:hypothetical protein